MVAGRLTACVGVLLLVVGGEGFGLHGSSVALRVGARPAAGAVCAAGGGSNTPRIAMPADPLARRRFLAASLVSVAGVQRAVAAEDVEEGEVEAGGPEEVVVRGEMRLEQGSDKKLQKAGGKAQAQVVLRCVGKGIISKTTEEITLEDFPVACATRCGPVRVPSVPRWQLLTPEVPRVRIRSPQDGPAPTGSLAVFHSS